MSFRATYANDVRPYFYYLPRAINYTTNWKKSFPIKVENFCIYETIRINTEWGGIYI